MDAGRRLTFGDFSLDLTSQRLWYRDEVAALTPKAFAVLRRLVEDRGQLVSKEELLRAGWAKTHVSEGVRARRPDARRIPCRGTGSADSACGRREQRRTPPSASEMSR